MASWLDSNFWIASLGVCSPAVFIGCCTVSGELQTQASTTSVMASEVAASLGGQFCVVLETFQEISPEKPVLSAFPTALWRLNSLSFYKNTRVQGENRLAQNYTNSLVVEPRQEPKPPNSQARAFPLEHTHPREKESRQGFLCHFMSVSGVGMWACVHVFV